MLERRFRLESPMLRLLTLCLVAWLCAPASGAAEETLSLVTRELSPEPFGEGAPQARALGGTELEHVAQRLARELGAEARPASFEASDGSAAYLLGHEGAEGAEGEQGQMLITGPWMGHVFEPAEVPGHGGELLRIPQLVVGLRHFAPGLEPRCGVAVLEMQLDPRSGVPHASGLRALTWANLSDFPQTCGVLRRLQQREEGEDALVFEAVMVDRREDSETPPAFRETLTASLLPGTFAAVEPVRRDPIPAVPSHLPLLIECVGVDDCSVKVPAQVAEIGSALVRAIASQLPEVRVLETSHGWGWTRVQLEGPRGQVDRFLAALQEDEQSGTLSAELVVRTGELARATVRFRTNE